MISFYMFHADWCAPCQQYKPIIERISKELGIKVNKINIEDEESFEPFINNVRSVPTLVVVKDGEVIDESVGMLLDYQLRDFFKDWSDKE